MEIIFENNSSALPKISIILVDWSSRESFHTLEYLNKQTIPRDQYEIIWIEYYGRIAHQMKMGLEECKKLGKPPILDRWIVLGMSEDICYHKHLMYNVSILASKGEVVTICDSDAVVTGTFIESIIRKFERNPNIVLHLDEARNTDRRFYPFSYPSIAEITGKRCVNWRDTTTIGLLDKKDFLHTRNYGSCMAAFRRDLINIGGADEHSDYLGHICGPYEMTFRLVNAGKREIWHQEEFLYHTWHPGTDGSNNYLGPHDGKNMSTTALDARSSGRVLPLVENPAIRMLRTDKEVVLYDSLLSQAIPELETIRWNPQKIQKNLKQNLMSCISMCRSVKKNPRYFLEYFMTNLALYQAIVLLIIKQVYGKKAGHVGSGKRIIQRNVFLEFRLCLVFFWRMFKNNLYTVSLCKHVLEELHLKKVKQIAVYGTGFIAKIIYILTRQVPIEISNIYSKSNVDSDYLGFKVLPWRSLVGFEGKVVIAYSTGILERITELREIGIKDEDIIKL